MSVDTINEELIDKIFGPYRNDPEPYHFDIDVLVDFMNDVVSWNAFARGNEDFVEEDVFKQQKLVNEEVRETMDASQKGDLVEVVDGICDVFVVFSYRQYMAQRLREKLNGADYIVRDRLMSILAENEYYGFVYPIMVKLYMVEHDKFDSSVPGVMGYEARKIVDEHFPDGLNIAKNLSAVMKSNWSKFPLVEDVPNIDAEIYEIERKYEEEKGERLTAVESIRTDDLGYDRYVFHNELTGKILKPTTFEKPQLIL